MVPSYGASTAHSVFHAFRQRSNPLSTSKTEDTAKGEMLISRPNSRTRKALTKSHDKGKTSSLSQLRPGSATPQVSTTTPQASTLNDSEDTDMVFMSSSKHIENPLSKNNSNPIFTDSDIQDIFRPRAGALSSPNSLSVLSNGTNGTSSPKRHSRTSRESTGSSCSEGHGDSLKSISSSGALSPLPQLLETLSPAERASMTRPQIVAQEILVTERTYVRDLQDVIEGYLMHLLHHGMTDVDIETIFGNLEDIYDFNKNILEELENIEEQRDPVLISQCFLRKAEGFNSLYVQYCTNYPESAAFLTEILKDKEIADFFLERQRALSHTLPIDSYLMKPVQRIMKYHLLFKDIAKHFELNTPGYDVIQTTAAAMADVAEYINEMKRLHENALRVEEILGSIEDLNGLDVFATGRLVLENLFRIHGSRGDKQLYLFEKLLLICKKLDEGNYQFRDGISCSNMMLIESIAKEPLCFQLIRFDNQKVTYTIQAKTIDVKKEWTKQLKRLIIENHSAMIPLTAREAILGPDKNVRESKYNTIPLQALDEKIHWRRQKQNSVSGKENQHKDRGSLLIGSKRESILKEEPTNSPKKSSLNTKAKEFLDKKDKEKSKPWKLKKNKARKSTANTSFEAELPQRQVASPNSDIVPPSTVVKSRSLESLKDALSNSQNNLMEAVEEDEPIEVQKPDKTTEQIRRLSLIQDLINSDPSIEQYVAQQADEEKAKMESPGTPKSIRALRRLHVSKSVYLDLPDDPLKPGDLKRSRPLSLPPEPPFVKDENETKMTHDEEMLKAFDGSIEKQPRACSDLRKYGLTRTRSLNRKHRGSTTSLTGSSTSVNAMAMDDVDKLSPRHSNNSDDVDQLEKRLSIISDDDKASSSIKNTLRQVSQAFSSYGSETALNSTSGQAGSQSNLSMDLGAFLTQDTTVRSASTRSKRRSLGSIIFETINPEISIFDETKRRAYSTTGINKINFDITGEESPITEQPENQEVMDIVGEESEISTGKTKRIEAKDSMPVNDTEAMHGTNYPETNTIPIDSRHESLSKTARRPALPNMTSPSSLHELNEDTPRNPEEPGLDETSVTKTSCENTDSNNETSLESDMSTPKRPAAPSSLNYVGSYAASVRRYRKKNTDIKESKSVYDRIREYTALVSEEKSLQRVKSMDEMLESLDSVSLPVSNDYMEQRRKFASMKSMDVDSEPAKSVLEYPEVWFDTEMEKLQKKPDSLPVTDNIRTGTSTDTTKPVKSPIDDTESEILKNAFNLSRIRFKDLEEERRKKESSDISLQKNIRNNNEDKAKKIHEATTLPRCKAGKSKVSFTERSFKGKGSVDVVLSNKGSVDVILSNKDVGVSSDRGSSHGVSSDRGSSQGVSFHRSSSQGVSSKNNKNTSQGVSSARDWKNRRSQTIHTCASDELDNNENISDKELFKKDPDLQSSIKVKDKVKEYYKAIIIPGEKEVSDTKDSTTRKSRKKRDKEAAKSNLTRKLSLRNLDAEEKEEKSKMNRSSSCESVQRGTVKHLISMFSIRK